MTADKANLLDDLRTACLCDARAPGLLAATAIAADGSEHYLLALRVAIGDESARYDPTTPQAPHEQLGELPSEFVRRLTVAARTHRCGRRTCKGRPCRIRVDRPGQACEFHRLATDDERTKQ
jgi:hypothetical protein